MVRIVSRQGLLSLLIVALGAAGAWAGQPEAGRVIARVNAVDITYGDLKLRVEMLEQDRGPVSPTRYKEILHALVREEILAQASIAAGIDKEPPLQQRIEVAKRQVLIEELLRRRVAARSQVGEEEMKKVYEENREAFSTEGVTVSHILVKTEAEAEAVRKELGEGKSFAEVAKAKSQDAGSAENGGELGVVSRGQTEPEFEAVAFALKDGEISQVVKTQYGYHVLKGGTQSKSVQSYDEVKPRLAEMLSKQKQRDALMGTMTDLEKQSKVELFEDRLE
jgi:EpsD family peptidyl-prolyl cis-trans isomerase